MRLYLVRHGETEGNRERRYLGWEDLPLNQRGEAQARALARSLADQPITAIYSSDLIRAQATAAPIAQVLGLPVHLDPDLREVNFGAWSGLTYAEIERRAPDRLRAWIDDPECHAPPGGESLGALRRRALRAVPLRDGALIVSHGGTLRALISHWAGARFWEVQVPLGSVTVVEWEEAPTYHLKVRYVTLTV